MRSVEFIPGEFDLTDIFYTWEQIVFRLRMNGPQLRHQVEVDDVNKVLINGKYILE